MDGVNKMPSETAILAWIGQVVIAITAVTGLIIGLSQKRLNDQNRLKVAADAQAADSLREENAKKFVYDLMKEGMDQLKVRLDDADQEAEELRKDLASMRERVKSVEVELSSARGIIASLNGRIARLCAQLEAAGLTPCE